MSEKMVNKITIHKLGHVFDAFVREDGSVSCAIDGESVAVDYMADGKIQFADKEKLIVNGEEVGIGWLSLSEEDFAALKEAQKHFAKPEVLAETGTAEAPDSRKTCGEDDEYWKLLFEKRKAAMKRVDSWSRKICSYKEKEKKGQKYCVHSFRIGNNKYRFVERNIDGVGVVINPDYKIHEGMTNVGGVPKQHGELWFWDYYFEGKGWERVRVLTYNEGICLDIILNYGFFAFPKEKETELKRQNSFLKKLIKKKAGKEERKKKPEKETALSETSE